MSYRDLMWKTLPIERLDKETPSLLDPEISEFIQIKKDAIEINAQNIYYRDLNDLIKHIAKWPASKIILNNITGQRYIGTSLRKKIEIEINGTPGNDLAAFMDGPRITVYGDVQDGCGNTMNQGEIIVHGSAGDVTGYSMRGGNIFIRDNIGYRAGIHMKEYKNMKPNIVVGGTAVDFLGEYMAGGVLAVLGLNLGENKTHDAKYVGTGMHGGIIYIHGRITHIGKEVEMRNLDEEDNKLLKELVKQYCEYFNTNKNVDEILGQDFVKLVPMSTRPYGRLYAY